MERITGNISYRTNIFGKVILMVEYKHDYDASDDCPKSIQTSLRWRDARSTDIYALAKVKEKP